MVANFRSILISIVSLCLILGASAAIIAYGRGYRFNVKQPSLRPTGIISATSDPIGAQVFLNDQLKTATNNSFNIEPGWYTVRVVKEGFLPWQKNLRVQGEVVSRADAFLFPANPNLSPLTTTGVEHPILSPDGTKIAYTVPGNPIKVGASKAGLWILELADRPLGRNRDPQQIALAESTVNFSEASLAWSPDSTEILVRTPQQARLYQISKPKVYEDVTISIEGLLNQWHDDYESKERQKLAAYPSEVINIATSSTKIIAFSQDETKVLYEATRSATLPKVINPPLIGSNPTNEERAIGPGRLYIYDSKEDKNFFVLDKKELGDLDNSKSISPDFQISKSLDLSPATVAQLQWFPTNRHLILVQKDKIDIMEYDRTNWITIYSGPFVAGFIAPWTNPSRLVILTNLNPGAGNLPNLYTINLR